MTDLDWAHSLPSLLGEAWRRLEAAEGAARNPALATTGHNGAPEIRTVILRSADRQAGTLAFHTDAESPKVAQLRRRPRAAILVWDAEVSLQVRLDARISVLSGSSSSSAWADVPEHARSRYGGSLPGTPISAPEAAEDGADLARFAVLTAYVHRIDALHLGASRHRRAVYRIEDGFAGRWVAP